MMFRRRALALAVAGALAFGVAGCSGPPAATPSTPAPAFTSDAAAYAAAEKTYRAYVKAGNEVNLSDPGTFEPLFAWTIGAANSGARKTFSQMHADGWKVAGATRIAKMEPYSFEARPNSVAKLDICLDVSAVTLTDSAGASVVDPGRPDVQQMRVTFVPAMQAKYHYLISSIDGRVDGLSCGG